MDYGIRYRSAMKGCYGSDNKDPAMNAENLQQRKYASDRTFIKKIHNAQLRINSPNKDHNKIWPAGQDLEDTFIHANWHKNLNK